MATNIVPTFEVEQFNATIELLVQQMGSRFEGSMDPGQHYGSQAAVVDQVGTVEVKEVVSRFAPIVRTDANTDRRNCFPIDFDLAQQVDQFDQLRIINDPEGWLVKAAVNAIGRKYDKIMIASFFATAYTGGQGTTSTIFPTGVQSVTGAASAMLAGNQIIPVNFKSSASIGLTAQKIIAAKQTFQLSEVDVDTEELYIAVGANQAANLMNEILITSRDFNSSPVFDKKGMIESWYGFNFIHSELLQVVSGNTLVPAWCKSGMHFGKWNSLYTKISQRDDLQGHPWQVYNMATAGATRKQEPKVVQILCA